MGDSQEPIEVYDTINKLLIEHVRERPTLHYTDTYTESDEQHWDEIQESIGIQKSWLKNRWKSIRNEHRKITIYNHIHRKKVPPHRMAQNLDFIVVDLNGASTMDFRELKRPKKESFCVTQEMLDICDISESVSADTISIQKLLKNESAADLKTETSSPVKQPPEIAKEIEIIAMKEQRIVVDESTNGDGISHKIETSLSTNERCEDTIFGELVVAMLKKMKPDDKKRAKKEIMNILL